MRNPCPPPPTLRPKPGPCSAHVCIAHPCVQEAWNPNHSDGFPERQASATVKKKAAGRTQRALQKPPSMDATMLGIELVDGQGMG